jgi:hypothetical protein
MTDDVLSCVNASLPLDIGRLPPLDKLQLSHLRCIDNLSQQPPSMSCGIRGSNPVVTAA